MLLYVVLVNSAVSLQTTANYDNFLVNNQFISSMKDILVADAASATTAESMAIASVQQTKSKGTQNVASKSGLAAISTTNSKKPSSTASKHSVALDEDVDDGKYLFIVLSNTLYNTASQCHE